MEYISEEQLAKELVECRDCGWGGHGDLLQQVEVEDGFDVQCPRCQSWDVEFWEFETVEQTADADICAIGDCTEPPKSSCEFCRGTGKMTIWGNDATQYIPVPCPCTGSNISRPSLLLETSTVPIAIDLDVDCTEPDNTPAPHAVYPPVYNIVTAFKDCSKSKKRRLKRQWYRRGELLKYRGY